jgi:hypothetical protein
LFGRDRFGWVILGFEQGSEDIWFNCWEGTFRLHRTTICGNRLYADDATKPLVKIGRQEESRELVVEANTVHAYTEPPAAGEFLAEDRQCYNK